MPHTSPNSDLPPGLSQPALRALAAAGISRLEQLNQYHEAEVLKMHGIGPNAMGKLRAAMTERGLSFKDGQKGK